MDLVEKLVVLHHALRRADIPHAYGGALALGWCTSQARGTIDIDLNILCDATQLDTIIPALPLEIVVTDGNRMELTTAGQTRCRWDGVPVDIFLNTTPFHDDLFDRVQWHELDGVRLPFLGCTDLATFKVFFNRPKDWVDLAAMFEVATVDGELVLGVVARYLELSDPRVARLQELLAAR